MDDLFTFNSNQFRLIPLLPLSTHSIRKRIISGIPPKRSSSIQSYSTAAEPTNSQKKLRTSLKKVDCSLVPSVQLCKGQSNFHDHCEEDSRNKQRSQQSKSIRYVGQLENKRSLQLQSSGRLGDRNWHHNDVSSAEAGDSGRNQRRIRSFRMSPKVVVPLSDRKLPKVFKMLGGQNYLPPLAEKSRKKRLAQRRTVRETFSSQRARVLLNYGEQLAELSKRVAVKDERQQSVQEG